MSQKVEDHFGKKLYEIFNLFFVPKIIQHKSEQTNLFVIRDKNTPNFYVTRKEMSKFLGLFLLNHT